LIAADSTDHPLPAMHISIINRQKSHFITVRTADRTKDRSEHGPVRGPRNIGTGPPVRSSVFRKGLKTGPDRTDGTLGGSVGCANESLPPCVLARVDIENDSDSR
jgi:hypothetical protein